MKYWFAITCPVCGWRHPPRKFNQSLEPIVYPVQIVTGGGRGKGFKVAEYLPWSTLPALRHTNVWDSLQYLYNRLAAAYDQFYEALGFLSPKMKNLLQKLKSYANAYQTNSFPDYARIYGSTASSRNIVDAYISDDYPEAYARFLLNPIPGGVYSG